MVRDKRGRMGMKERANGCGCALVPEGQKS